MAQLRESTIDGNLDITGNIVVKETNKGLYCIHPETGEQYAMVHMNPYGNTVIGYDGYANQNANSFVCGNDIENHVASADTHYRPYYRAGDVINFNVRTSGYVTNSGKSVFFTIPITKPVIGAPNAAASSEKGFILRQNGYTHGCDGATTPATYVKPSSYHIDSNFNSGFIITAIFDATTNVENNSPIGIYWDGTITLS